MIRTVELKNFKCFKSVTIPFRKLTLLTGMNGYGKSTILQSLLLLRQTYKQSLLTDSGALLLNGEYCELGASKDILCEFFEGEEESYSLSATFDQTGSIYARIHHNENSDLPKIDELRISGDLKNCSLFGDSFSYLSAERYGPRNIYPFSEHKVMNQRELGIHGEFTAHYLANWGIGPIDPELSAVMEEAGTTLHSIVEYWMRQVRPDVRVHAGALAEISGAKLLYSFIGDERLPTSQYRGTSVGYGLSFVLPIVVSALSARKGGLQIIENPEAHLHPRGQTKVGSLLSLVAASTSQVVIESHSDHVLNAVRLAVKNGAIAKEDVSIIFFREPQEFAAEQPFSVLEIDSNGRIAKWPDGFFDEMEHVLGDLL